MGTIVVGIIVLAVVINALRMFLNQINHMKNQNCTGDCNSCKMPCQAKHIYHIDDSDPDR